MSCWHTHSKGTITTLSGNSYNHMDQLIWIEMKNKSGKDKEELRLFISLMHTALTTKLSRAQLSLRSHVLIFLKYPKIIYIASSLKQKKKKHLNISATHKHTKLQLNICFTYTHKATLAHLYSTQTYTCTSLLHTNLHLHISATCKPTNTH